MLLKDTQRSPFKNPNVFCFFFFKFPHPVTLSEAYLPRQPLLSITIKG